MAFVDKKSGEVVNILSDDVNFYTLDNGIRIKKDVFYKKYEEQKEVDPNTFFQTQPSLNPILNLANQLKSIDTSKIPDETDGTKIKYTPPVVLSDNSNPNSVVKQQQIEENVTLTPEQKKAMLEEWRRTQPGAQIQEVQERNWEDVSEDRFLHGDKPITAKAPEPKVDPIQMMFKMFKNNYPVKLNIEIEENIPNPTFIGMVQENVEADAVDYYANLILNKLINDTDRLKNEIYTQLKTIINKELES